MVSVITDFSNDVNDNLTAWVLGATDPTSGTASIHEVIRGLGHLLRNGWKPLRTILIASWDAEEVIQPLILECSVLTIISMV